jgi:hypothetical protein
MTVTVLEPRPDLQVDLAEDVDLQVTGPRALGPGQAADGPTAAREPPSGPYLRPSTTKRLES